MESSWAAARNIMISFDARIYGNIPKMSAVGNTCKKWQQKLPNVGTKRWPVSRDGGFSATTRHIQSVWLLPPIPYKVSAVIGLMRGHRQNQMAQSWTIGLVPYKLIKGDLQPRVNLQVETTPHCVFSVTLCFPLVFPGCYRSCIAGHSVTAEIQL